MKALSDTNPLVSALLQPEGPSGQIFQRWRSGGFELAVSPATLAELGVALRAYAEVAPGVLTLDVVHEDEMDNHVPAAAMETRSAYVISDDRHLLDIGEFQGIRILRPREFLTILSQMSAGDEPALGTSLGTEAND